MAKNLQIPVTNELYYLFERLAHYDDRTLRDYMYLILSTGLQFQYVEKQFCIKKLPHEYTEKEKKQIEFNKTLEERTKGWSQKSCQEKKALGYVYVEEWHGSEKLYQMEKQIRNLILDSSPLDRDNNFDFGQGKRTVKKVPKNPNL